jgi:glycerophosphoryl diester phosphodiesterase
VIVVSIRDWWLRPFRRSAPSVPTAAGGVALVAFFLASRIWVPLPYRRPVAVQVPWRLLGKRICDRRLTWAAHRRGMAVHVWTVDDPSIMRRAIAIGVDGIMTDTPTVLAAVLADTGKGWHPPA